MYWSVLVLKTCFCICIMVLIIFIYRNRSSLGDKKLLFDYSLFNFLHLFITKAGYVLTEQFISIVAFLFIR